MSYKAVNEAFAVAKTQSPSLREVVRRKRQGEAAAREAFWRAAAKEGQTHVARLVEIIDEREKCFTASRSISAAVNLLREAGYDVIPPKCDGCNGEGWTPNADGSGAICPTGNGTDAGP